MKSLALLAPVILVIVFAVLGEGLGNLLGNSPWARAVGACCAGVLGGAIILWVHQKIFGAAAPAWGGPKALGMGLAVGALVSCAAGFALISSAPAPEWSAFWQNIGPRLLGNLGPATLEESGFRGALTQTVLVLWGKTAALGASSIPFGVAHLLGMFFGKPLMLGHILGTTLAGLFLGVTYLRWGLGAAITCHYVWNLMGPGWAQVAGLAPGPGVLALESAPATLAVLALASLAIGLAPK